MAENPVNYDKPDGVHYDPKDAPRYIYDTSKPYYSFVNMFGGPNRFAIRIEQDAEFWNTKPEAAAFREDWPRFFNKEWREKWYGEDFVFEDLKGR